MYLFLFWSRPKLFTFHPPPSLPTWVPAVCSSNNSPGAERIYDPAESTSCEAKMVDNSLTGNQHHGPMEVEASTALTEDWMLFFPGISKSVVQNMCSVLHLAFAKPDGKLLRIEAVMVWSKICPHNFSRHTWANSASALCCLGALHLHWCDANPWLRHLVSKQASVPHATCHDFQFGAPSSNRIVCWNLKNKKCCLRSLSLRKKSV